LQKAQKAQKAQKSANLFCNLGRRLNRGMSIEIRSANIDDIGAILKLIQGKAEFDGCLELLFSSEADIKDAFFSATPKANGILAFENDEAIGIATYYSIYSTFIAKLGIWLDDLFVYPGSRKSRAGKALISKLCNIALDTGCGRIDWIVARDNENGKGFYEYLGANIFEEVRHARLDQKAIEKLVGKQA
jgi:GNAT superfamily N-acetyltransferase